MPLMSAKLSRMAWSRGGRGSGGAAAGVFGSMKVDIEFWTGVLWGCLSV